MPGYLAIDADGWVRGAIVTEGPEWSSLPMGWRQIDEDDAQLIAANALGMVREQDGTLRVPHDDRLAWQAAMALGAAHAADAMAWCRRLDPLRDRWPDWHPGTEPPARPVLHASSAPIGPIDPAIPDLAWRVLTVEDLSVAAALAVETGIYPPACPGTDCQCRPPEAHAWMRLARRMWRADGWTLVLAWGSTPLQIEQIDLTSHPPTVVLTFHVSRERPHWFWRECERPVLERLMALGHQTLQTRTRRDRPDWIATLVRNYGAVELGPVDEFRTALSIDLATAIGRMQGWPPRPSLSAGGALRSLTPDEADPLIRASWGETHPRLALALRMAREWYVLDRAALVSSPDGVVRAVRWRDRDTQTIAMAWLTPLQSSAASPEVLAWLGQLGARRVTSFVPAAAARRPDVRALLSAHGFSELGVRRFPGGDFVEIERAI